MSAGRLLFFVIVGLAAWFYPLGAAGGFLVVLYRWSALDRSRKRFVVELLTPGPKRHFDLLVELRVIIPDDRVIDKLLHLMELEGTIEHYRDRSVDETFWRLSKDKPPYGGWPKKILKKLRPRLLPQPSPTPLPL